MMRPPLMTLAISALMLAQPAFAADPPNSLPPKPGPAISGKAAGRLAGHGDATHYWYEDGKRRALRVDPAWIADFAAPAAPQPGRRPSPLKRSIGGEKALESLPGTASPVFRDDNGAQRALAGGVIVHLRAADRADARERLAAAGLQPVRPVDPDGRAWLVASPAGMPALELANRLHESGQFESATPNWWRPRALK